MITRFKLETEGMSPRDCEQQIDKTVNEITNLEGTTKEKWEITDFVSWKKKGTKNPVVYAARIVMKRKKRDE